VQEEKLPGLDSNQ